jgi:hypothetical protein
MDAFNLRKLVRDVLANSLLADPRDLAAEAFLRIPAAEHAAALRQCLTDVVREEIRLSRNHTPPTVTAGRPGPRGNTARQQPAVARSSKVAGIRAMWQEKLRERIHTGPASTDWRLLGDCTFDELMFAAGERRTIALRNESKAAEYAELAEAVRAAGVARVRDLPAEVLKNRLESEAA